MLSPGSITTFSCSCPTGPSLLQAATLNRAYLRTTSKSTSRRICSTLTEALRPDPHRRRRARLHHLRSVIQRAHSGRSDIASVVLMKAGSVTHSFDMDQRYVGLTFTAGQTAGTLTVTGPPDSNIAPPGYYMLFLVNKAGTPSVAAWVQVSGAAAPVANVQFHHRANTHTPVHHSRQACNRVRSADA